MKRQFALRKTISRLTVAFAALLSIALPVAQASAQELSLIRDAETEALIADYTMPIFRAAGVASNNIKVHLVNDTSFNAFVVDGRNMFINTGAILLSETPNQLIGVIAHETGHIKGGHITGLRQQIAKMQTAALMLQVLSLGAVVGGAATGNTDTAQAGTAMMFGGQQVLMRSISVLSPRAGIVRRSGWRGLSDQIASIAGRNAEDIPLFRGSVGGYDQGRSVHPISPGSDGPYCATARDRAA